MPKLPLQNNWQAESSGYITYEICLLWEVLGPDPENSVVTCPQSFNLDFLGSSAPCGVGDGTNRDLK